MRSDTGRLALSLIALVACAPALAAEPLPKVAVFPFRLIDSSLEGEVAGAEAETARLALMTDDLRARIADSGRLEVVYPEEARAACPACEVAAAGRAGADYALTGWVQKVSDLILNINLRVRNVRSGDVVFQDSVDIRGNTDRSWLRGLRYLVERRLLAPA